MKTKILIALLTVSVFSISTINAQEKAAMKMDHSKMKQELTEKVAYSCPMHADVKSDKPGECSKCGMDLTKMEVAKKAQCCAGKKMDSEKMTCDEMSKTYTCPMHADVKSDKPGKCPKCGMDLKEKKMEMKKEDK